jgi:hypothetical protein
MGSMIWAAACPRPTVLSPRGIATTLASLPSVEPVRYASLESGRVRPGGADVRVEQHVCAMFSATQTNAQVKGAMKRAALGPHPWRPPE